MPAASSTSPARALRGAGERAGTRLGGASAAGGRKRRFGASRWRQAAPIGAGSKEARINRVSAMTSAAVSATPWHKRHRSRARAVRPPPPPAAARCDTEAHDRQGVERASTTRLACSSRTRAPRPRRCSIASAASVSLGHEPRCRRVPPEAVRSRAEALGPAPGGSETTSGSSHRTTSHVCAMLLGSFDRVNAPKHNDTKQPLPAAGGLPWRSDALGFRRPTCLVFLPDVETLFLWARYAAAHLDELRGRALGGPRSC